MVSAVSAVYDLLNTLEEEDYQMAISYIRFLSDSRKKARVKKTAEVIGQIRSVIGDDRGWESEDEMLADMAAFRKERMGL